MVIYLTLMAEAFFGYLLPWGNMSYWGAQVIISLFAAIPYIGEGLVVHGQENSRYDLQNQNEKCQRSENIPEIEIFRCIVLGYVLFPRFRRGVALINPVTKFCNHAKSSLVVSTPISTRESDRNRCGGTSRLVGAGTFLNTRPAKSNFDP